MRTTDTAPPLPDFLPPAPSSQDDAPGPGRPVITRPPLRIRSIRCGCWLIAYQPTTSARVAFDGTLRVECHSEGRTASGDLYQRPVFFLPTRPPRAVLAPPPNPAAGIPIQPRARYRYYVRVTELPEQFFFNDRFTLRFELWRFTAPNAWALEQTLAAEMVRMTAPSGFPSPADYAEGDVRNASGLIVGRLTMGWLSKFYRRATIEIDNVAGSEQPLDGGSGHTWATVMNDLGWDVNVVTSDSDVAEPSGDSWSDAEMHAAMLARRAAVNLDEEWRYHILAVKNIDSTPRGIMYDLAGTDSNHVPREGVGIASHWTVDQGWGSVSGLRFGTAAAPYFRTAVHELGHAMGLVHNFADMGFMCTSDVIAQAGTAANPFPGNIRWAYHTDNLKQLRHYPDPFVRPGGVAFGGASVTSPTITPTDLEVGVDGLTLEVDPLLREVPIGAPVRIEYRITNHGDRPIAIPADLTLKSEAIAGEVTDPSGTVRTFRTVVHCVEDHRFQSLAPGQTVAESATLMRGAEGALFGMGGIHRVVVQASWEADGMLATVRGETTVMVTPAENAEHAAAAHRILSTPDAHLVLAIGGDHLTEGVAAIQAALDSAVLRPHYAVIEAKRVGRRFARRKPDVKAAARLIDDKTVMSGAEIGRMARIAAESGGQASVELGKRVKARSKGRALPAAARRALDQL